MAPVRCLSSFDPTHPVSEVTSRPDYDPVYLHARRELAVIVLIFSALLLWVLPVSYWLGYVPSGDDAREIATVWGLPRWVFWGVLVPWLAADLAIGWFCFFYMADDPLGETREGEDVREQLSDDTHQA